MARLMAKDGEKIDRIVGTEKYLAPELLAKKFVGSFTDIYCLGLILYELATTDLKEFSKPDLATFKIHDTYSPKLSAAIKSMLDPDYRARPTAESLLEMDWLNVASIDDSEGGRAELFGKEFHEDLIYKEDMKKRSISGVYGGEGNSLLMDLSIMSTRM